MGDKDKSKILPKVQKPLLEQTKSEKMKAYKYRIYPTKKQAIAIDESVEQCRQLYNELLSLKRNAYEKDKISLSRKDLYKQVKGINKIHSQVAQNVGDRIDKCSNCGLKIDRDTNASINILTIGKIGLEQPKLTPERDETTTDGISPKQALSMKQEATQLVGS